MSDSGEARKRNCILAADDDPQIRRFLRVLAGNCGITLWTAAGGEEGIELYRTHRDEIALVLLDVQMPELDGPATLVRVRAIDPSVKCWFMSGNIGAYRVEDLRGLGCGILVKPFSPADFGSMIASEGLLEAQTTQVGNGHSSGPIQSSKRE